MRASHARTAGLLAVSLAGLLALGACQGGDHTSVQSPVTTVGRTTETTGAVTGSSLSDTTEVASTETTENGGSLPADGSTDTTGSPVTTVRSTPATTAAGSVTVTVDPAVEQAIASMSSLLSATDVNLTQAAAGVANGG